MTQQQVPTVQLNDLPHDGRLIDVREDDEWQAGHAPNAVHIPMGDIPTRLGELPAEDTLYVICRTGGRSSRATAFLNANGWDAVNVDGGMLSWQAAGRPMVAEGDGQPQVL